MKDRAAVETSSEETADQDGRHQHYKATRSCDCESANCDYCDAANG